MPLFSCLSRSSSRRTEPLDTSGKLQGTNGGLFAKEESGGGAAYGECPSLPSRSIDTGTNWYRRDNGTGTWGGTCKCPDGQVYQVADNYDNCKSLACEGGSSGQCSQNIPSYAQHMRVTCGMLNPLKKEEPEGPAKCAEEGGICYCDGTVRFTDGVGHTMSKQVDEAVACDVANFGDPYAGAPKHCTCTPGVSTKNVCQQGENCSCSGTVRYGTSEHYTSKEVDGQYQCTQGSFGGFDPSGQGAKNDCTCIPEYHKCAEEGGTCQCDGQVMYGADYHWAAPRQVNGTVACTNQEFGDPKWVSSKNCYCLPSSKH
jgi:hypothetical protein